MLRPGLLAESINEIRVSFYGTLIEGISKHSHYTDLVLDGTARGDVRVPCIPPC